MLTTIKGYLIAGLAAALVLAFGWWTFHERSVEHKEDAQADKTLAAKAVAHNTEVESNAQKAIDAAVAAYAAAHPVVAAPDLVCTLSVPPRRSIVSSIASAAGIGDAAPAVPEESAGPPFNPAPAVLRNDADADAQVTELQAYVRACQAAGICAKK